MHNFRGAKYCLNLHHLSKQLWLTMGTGNKDSKCTEIDIVNILLLNSYFTKTEACIRSPQKQEKKSHCCLESLLSIQWPELQHSSPASGAFCRCTWLIAWTIIIFKASKMPFCFFQYGRHHFHSILHLELYLSKLKRAYSI